MNNCCFLGRLTRDVELKYTSNETAIANFTLAVDRSFKKEGQPTADFLPHVAIGKLAEVIAKYCSKGSQIAVTSRCQTRNYDDADGNKKYVTEFIIEKFNFAGNKNNTNQEASVDDNDSFEL